MTETTGSASRRTADIWIALVTLAAASIYSVFGSFYVADEAWSLQVASRFASGEIPYRDFYYPATPLALWIGGWLVKLAGVDYRVLRALVFVCFAALVVLCLVAARRLKIPIVGRAAVAAGLIAFAPPGLCGPGSTYNPLSQPLLVGSLIATLAWIATRDDRSVGHAALIGIVAGALTATKQNLGIYVIAVVLGVIVYTAWRDGSVRAALAPSFAVVGAFVLVVGLSFLPILLSGALPGFIERAFGMKNSTYIAGGTITYSAGLAELWRLLFQPKDIFEFARLGELVAWLLAPATAVISLVVLVWKKSPTSAAVAAFVLVGIAAGFPRWDAHHLAIGAPLVIIGFVYGVWSLSRDKVRDRSVQAVAAGFSALALLLLYSTVMAGIIGARVPLGLPGFARAWVAVEERDVAHQAIRDLSHQAGPRTFIVSTQAGLLYLVSGLDNPLPNDYPHPTSATEADARTLAGALRSGAVDVVWAERATQTKGVWRAERLMNVLASEAVTRTQTPVGITYVPAR